MIRNNKNVIIKYFILSLALLIAAVNFNLLLKPFNLVAGGTSGLSLIVEYVFAMSSNTFITIVYIITFIISYLLLGKKSLVGVLYATIFYPLFVYLTRDIQNIIVINNNDMLLNAIFSGLLSGISSGLIYKYGFASSGLGVFAPILNKYFKFSISSSNFIINTLIVLLGGYYFGIEMILCAIILLYINNVVCNRIILGVSSNKAIYVCSSNIDKIDEYIKRIYNIKTTIIESEKNGKVREILFVVVPSIKYNQILYTMKKIDKNLFYSVCDSYELNS